MSQIRIIEEAMLGYFSGGANVFVIGSGDSSDHAEHVALVFKEEDARRIVAAINACEGLPTDLLEKHGVTRSGIAKWADDTAKQRDQLQAALSATVEQRDELMKALDGLHRVCSIALEGKDGKQHSYFETRAGHFVEATAAMQSAEAAIASVKGGAV